MSQTGDFLTDEVLDIGNFYEMSVFTADNIPYPFPVIMCSNDGMAWVEYDKMDRPYLYLSDLMANKIKIVSEQQLMIHYNANLKV